MRQGQDGGKAVGLVGGRYMALRANLIVNNRPKVDRLIFEIPARQQTFKNSIRQVRRPYCAKLAIAAISTQRGRWIPIPIFALSIHRCRSGSKPFYVRTSSSKSFATTRVPLKSRCTSRLSASTIASSPRGR